MVRDLAPCLASLCSNTIYSYIHVLILKKKLHFIFPTTKGSMRMHVQNLLRSVLPTVLKVSYNTSPLGVSFL